MDQSNKMHTFPKGQTCLSINIRHEQHKIPLGGQHISKVQYYDNYKQSMINKEYTNVHHIFF